MPEASDSANSDLNFWDHLGELRKRLIRVVIFFFIAFVIAFSFREILFDELILRLMDNDFITYHWFCKLALWTGISDLCPEKIGFNLINIHLAGQFLAHITVSAMAALILSLPILAHQLWLFIKPALHRNEVNAIRRSVWLSVMLFIMGIALGYFILTPFSIVFLGNYQVSPIVGNQITLSSYLSVFTSTIILSGLIFEMPLVFIVLARIGILTNKSLRMWRKYVLVACLILAAIITPSTDPFSMFLLALPLYLLFEISLIFVKRIEQNGSKANS